MTHPLPSEVEIHTETDVLRARRAAKSLAIQVGFEEIDVVRLVTVVSELARNVVKYGESGTCNFRVFQGTRKTRVRCVIQDVGPGIPDIEAALSDGFSTGATLGKGLPGVKRISDRFNLRTSEAGTMIEIEIQEQRRHDKATSENG